MLEKEFDPPVESNNIQILHIINERRWKGPGSYTYKGYVHTDCKCSEENIMFGPFISCEQFNEIPSCGNVNGFFISKELVDLCPNGCPDQYKDDKQ
jgi:hypothetical protein